MASPLVALLCALAATAVFALVGLPLARRIAPDVALALSPALGWALVSGAAVPLLSVAGFSPGTVATLAAVAVALSLLGLRRSSHGPIAPSPSATAYAAAALLACCVAAAVAPKIEADGVSLAAPIFDHSKVAIVDEIARMGLPPANPFVGPGEAPSRLAYYYGWHLSAATLALLPGVDGWEADMALTAVTAFAALALMMGLAVRASGRRSAAVWVVGLSVAASLRPVLKSVISEPAFDAAFSSYPGLGAWIVQATWAPQHMASASCVVLSGLLMHRLAATGDRLAAPALALVAAAGFGASVWVGGVTFALAAAGLGLYLLQRAASRRRVGFAGQALLAAALTVALAFPFLRDQLAAAQAGAQGLPIALKPYEVLGSAVPDPWRRWLDLPAYWLVLLPLEFPAIALAGVMGFFATLKAGRDDRSGVLDPLAPALALVGVACLAVGGLLVSTILNNDLGWRAVLPGVLILTIFAAAGLARWTAPPLRRAALAPLALLALGLPDGLRFIADGFIGRAVPGRAAFAAAPELWAAVRRHARPEERVANDPLYLADMTPWPINVSWALLADRRSCYAGWEFARPFSGLNRAAVDDLDRRFRNIFSATGRPEEIADLAARYDCRVFALTASDGAWTADPFARTPGLTLVEEKLGAWRIYRSAEGR